MFSSQSSLESLSKECSCISSPVVRPCRKFFTSKSSPSSLRGTNLLLLDADYDVGLINLALEVSPLFSLRVVSHSFRIVRRKRHKSEARFQF